MIFLFSYIFFKKKNIFLINEEIYCSFCFVVIYSMTYLGWDRGMFPAIFIFIFFWWFILKYLFYFEFTCFCWFFGILVSFDIQEKILFIEFLRFYFMGHLEYFSWFEWFILEHVWFRYKKRQSGDIFFYSWI